MYMVVSLFRGPSVEAISDNIRIKDMVSKQIKKPEERAHQRASSPSRWRTISTFVAKFVYEIPFMVPDHAFWNTANINIHLELQSFLHGSR